MNTSATTPAAAAGSDVWMQTASGRQVFLLNARAESIDITDIAHHLSMLCRWVGAVREFYSVAQHSVLTAGLVAPEHRLWALLHDASEAYLGDVNARLKRSPVMQRYVAVEAVLQLQIYRRFGLRGDVPTKEIDEADMLMRAAEAHQLLTRVPPGMEHLPRAPFTIKPLAPPVAKQKFLEAYRRALETANVTDPRR